MKSYLMMVSYCLIIRVMVLNSCSSTYRMVLACEKLSYDGKLTSINQGDGPN